MTYSVDFRRRVLSIRKKEELTLEQTSQRFGVGRASLCRWLKRLEPDQSKPRRRKIDLAALAEDVRNHPDAYLHERAARFGVVPNAIFQALRRLGVTHKKALKHPKADDVRRCVFQKKIEQYESDNRSIIYIDESGFATDMPRTHGYSLRGKRCFGTQNWNARGRTNAIGALHAGALLSVGLTQANVDADIFNLWLRSDLLPKLPPGSVLVMDNATFHKRQDTKTMIAHAGHILEYLPPYSPDLNPIEHKWAQAKAIRRKTGKSTETIFESELCG